jgi:enterochelin esterase-like enzyme
MKMTLLKLAFFFLITIAARPEDWNNPSREKIPGLQHGTFQSASMKVEVGFNIYLPPDYAALKASRFAVIYYLHGLKGHESSYVDYARLLNSAVAARAVHPMILVLANGGSTSFFSDAPDGSIMGETVIIRELIPHIDGHYRTMASAKGRALHGFSMGGFGALKFAFKYPEMFGAVVTFDALLPDAKALRGEEKKLFTKMFEDDAGFAKSDPFAWLQNNAGKLRAQSIQIAVTDEEPEILKGNRKLHASLERLQIPHEYKEWPGVSHKKQELYKKAALPAFQFTDRALNH